MKKGGEKQERKEVYGIKRKRKEVWRIKGKEVGK